MLTKEQILKADDLVSQEVDVPEWGGTVNVRTMTGTERDAFEAASFEGRGKSTKVNLVNMRARLCAMTIVDDNGKRLFTDADIAELGKKSAKALDGVFAVAQKLNGLSVGDVEELAKNSESGPNGDSTSN
jgi:hypothetical protein